MKYFWEKGGSSYPDDIDYRDGSHNIAGYVRKYVDEKNWLAYVYDINYEGEYATKEEAMAVVEAMVAMNDK